MASIIRKEDHDCILIKLKSLKGGLYRSYAVIHALNHSCVGRILMSAHRRLLLIFCLQLRLGLNRCMNSVMGEVEEKGIVLVLLYKLAGLLSQPIGQVLALLLGNEIRVIVRAMVTTPTGTPPMFAGNIHVKTLGCGIITQMPFTHGSGHIPR